MFQRDLPYGFEYLGENLADVSHLPFSHHSVGALNREDSCPIPLELLSEAEKLDVAKLHKNEDKRLSTFQVRVVNAGEHDPEIVAALKYNPQSSPKLNPGWPPVLLGSMALVMFSTIAIKVSQVS